MQSLNWQSPPKLITHWWHQAQSHLPPVLLINCLWIWAPCDSLLGFDNLLKQLSELRENSLLSITSLCSRLQLRKLPDKKMRGKGTGPLYSFQKHQLPTTWSVHWSGNQMNGGEFEWLTPKENVYSRSYLRHAMVPQFHAFQKYYYKNTCFCGTKRTFSQEKGFLLLFNQQLYH